MTRGDETLRQRRRDNMGKRLKLCSRCNQRLARHSVNGEQLCCYCYVAAGRQPADWHPECMVAAGGVAEAKGSMLILRRASLGSEDYDVLCDEKVVGRIFLAAHSPRGAAWMWTIPYSQHEGRTRTHGHESTPEAAMAAFAESWRRE